MTIDRTAFLVRTHKYNWQVQELLCNLNRHMTNNVFVVCDETTGNIDIPNAPKISISPTVIGKWDFAWHPKNWGWFCGDYCYYAAVEEIGDFDFFCLIEADVYLGAKGIQAVKAVLDGNDSAALAADLRRFEKPPRFSNDLAVLGENPNFGCIFPFTRVQKDLIEEMFKLRKRVQNHHAPLRVNDEAILATAAHAKGVTCTNLYDFEQVFEKGCFATNPPHLYEAVRSFHDSERIYHPVATVATLFDRISSGEKKYSTHRLRRLLREAPDHVGRALVAAQARSRSLSGATIKNQRARTDRLGCLINLLKSFHPIEVVDVGANPIEGEANYAHLLETGQANLIGFEPNEAAFEELMKSKAPNEQYHCLALGKGGEADLHLTRHSGFSSVFPPDASSGEYLGFRRDMKVTRKQLVETHRLDDLDFIPPVDFLKIDIQGGELDVIRNAHDKLSRALVVQTEVRFFPLYENEPGFGDLEKELREQGLLFHSFDFLKKTLGNRSLRKKIRRRAFSQVVDGDAFFVRDLRFLHTYSEEKLSKLCVLADNVMGAFDLACLCLQELQDRGEIAAADIEHYFSLLPIGVRR